MELELLSFSYNVRNVICTIDAQGRINKCDGNSDRGAGKAGGIGGEGERTKT